MKKVIDGRKYSTDTATLVGTFDSGDSADDPEHWSESLYRKRNGEYFLHQVGGADSAYCRYIGGEPVPGEDIEPLSYGAARRWTEMHLDGDAYEAEFGDPGEGDDEQAAVNVQVSASAKARLMRVVSETGKTQSQIIEELLGTL